MPEADNSINATPLLHLLIPLHPLLVVYIVVVAVTDWCVGGGCGGRRVATARQYILSKIDARRPAASSARSDATAKEGHVNYDVSDVPVEARAAPTMGSGCYGWVTAHARRCKK